MNYESRLVDHLGSSEAELITENLFENPNRERSDAENKVHCPDVVKKRKHLRGIRIASEPHFDYRMFETKSLW